jgi:heme/copper-type cytochrome/quinol oxidase subunit 2
VVIFPIFSALISALCAAVIARDAIQKPRPDKFAWSIAFAIFAVAAASEALGSINEWTPTLVRTYYLTGAVLVVGFLALGELYLLAGKSIARFAPGVAVLATAFATALVFNAPVDQTKLADDGWEALERSTILTITTVTLNAGGTLVIVGGLLYSAWKFRRLGIYRNRMIGCVLIAIGTLIVAMGGTATRLGAREYFYVAMSIGVAVIFAGYLWTRRADGAPLFERRMADGGRRMAATTSPAIARSFADPALQFIESELLVLDDSALELRCAEWSVPRDPLEVLRRDEAIAAWQLRLLLSELGQTRFDALTVPARRQVTDLYRLVLIAEPTPEFAQTLVLGLGR